MEPKHIKPQPSTVGLVAHYKLWDGFTSGVTVFDYSLGGLTGTATNSPTQQYPGFSFVAGSSQFIDIGTGPTSVSTVLLWVKPGGIGGTNYYIDLNGTDYLTSVFTNLTQNGFAGGTAILYVDGEAAITVSANWHLIGITDTVAKDASDLDIGRVATSYYSGVIGETMLYNRVLTPADIKSVYELTKWRYE